MTAIEIIREIAAAHGLSPLVLRGRQQPFRFFEVRQIAIRRIREERGLSLTQIGRLFDNRDHSTIYYYVSGTRRRKNRKPYPRYDVRDHNGRFLRVTATKN